MVCNVSSPYEGSVLVCDGLHFMTGTVPELCRSQTSLQSYPYPFRIQQLSGHKSS